MTTKREGQTIGLVLAAGRGSRLTLDGVPRLKPLVPVAGRPLIQRALCGLARAGCSRVVVVLGHEAERIRAGARAGAPPGLDLVFVSNPDYHLQNGISVLAAGPHLTGRFILIMADHVVDDAILELAARHRPPPRGATLLIDRKIDTVLDLDDATKVRCPADRILEIGKGLSPFDAIDTGVFVCTPALVEALAAVCASKGDASLSEGVGRLAATGRMAGLDIGSACWQDVDDLAMLRAAELALATGRIRCRPLAPAAGVTPAVHERAPG